MTTAKIDCGKQLKEGDINLISQQKLWTPKPWKGMGYLLLYCSWEVGVSEVPELHRPKANGLGCPPEIDAKTLVLKSLCSLVAGHREIKL